MRRKILWRFANFLFRHFPDAAAFMTVIYLKGAYNAFGIHSEEDNVVLLVASDSEALLDLLEQGAITLKRFRENGELS